MLAGIPKAPSRNNPLSGPEAGKERRDWIRGRMLTLGYIDDSEHASAVQAPVTARHHGAQLSFQAHYAAEMARQQMLEKYGMAAYNDGYQVYTTVSSELQQLAQQVVNNGLISYDKRHGYRGPERQLPLADPDSDPESEARPLELWLDTLGDTAVIAGLHPAFVTDVLEDSVNILLADGSSAELWWDNGIRQAVPTSANIQKVVHPKHRLMYWPSAT